jgi:hypothetical protein
MKVPSTTTLSFPTLSPLLTAGKNIVGYFLNSPRRYGLKPLVIVRDGLFMPVYICTTVLGLLRHSLEYYGSNGLLSNVGALLSFYTVKSNKAGIFLPEFHILTIHSHNPTLQKFDN